MKTGRGGESLEDLDPVINIKLVGRAQAGRKLLQNQQVGGAQAGRKLL